jgi:hypothetical protein
MADVSSRPRRSPNRTGVRTERRIVALRFTRRWGPHRIAAHLHLARSTVGKVLARYRMPRLACLDQGTGLPVRKPAPQRYEHDHPGDLIHVDIKKLGRIPNGGGHRALGRAKGRRNKRTGSQRADQLLRTHWWRGPGQTSSQQRAYHRWPVLRGVGEHRCQEHTGRLVTFERLPQPSLYLRPGVPAVQKSGQLLIYLRRHRIPEKFLKVRPHTPSRLPHTHIHQRFLLTDSGLRPATRSTN